MMVLDCLFYVIVIMLCGLATVALILGSSRRPFGEMLGLILLLGAGTLGTLLIWASMIGAKPTRTIIFAIGFCAMGIIALSGFLRGIPRPLWPRFRRPTSNDLALLLPLIPIVGAVLMTTMISLRFDLFEGDAIVIWGFKAKVLFLEPLRPTPAALTDPGLSFSHQDYPLLLPMLVAGAYTMIGSASEAAGRLVFPLLFIGQALLSYSAARRWLPPFHALVVTALLVCMPFAVLFSAVGNPDAAIETFYLGALVYLLRWIDVPRRADLIICALFCAFAATTKSEGMPLAVIHSLVLLAFILIRRNQSHAWLDFGVFLTTVLGIAGVWWVWRLNLPHTVDHYEAQLRFSILMNNLGRLGVIIPALADEMIAISRWGIFWLLVPFAAIVGYKAYSKPQTWVLWTLLILHVGLYVLVYIITTWDVAKLLFVSGNRLMLHMAPAGMLLIALHWSALRPILPPAE